VLAVFTNTQVAVLCEPMLTSQEYLVSVVKQLENDPAIDNLICIMFKNRYGPLLDGLHVNGRDSDDECPCHAYILLGRVPHLTVGNDALACCL